MFCLGTNLLLKRVEVHTLIISYPELGRVAVPKTKLKLARAARPTHRSLAKLNSPRVGLSTRATHPQLSNAVGQKIDWVTFAWKFNTYLLSRLWTVFDCEAKMLLTLFTIIQSVNQTLSPSQINAIQARTNTVRHLQ